MRSLKQHSVRRDALLYSASLNGHHILAEFDSEASDLYLSNCTVEALKLDHMKKKKMWS